MKTLRVFLQLAILGAGGIVLAALVFPPNPDFTIVFGFLGFVAFLFALTLVLKEETETRLLPGREKSFKPMGRALILLGAFGVFYGVSVLVGSQSMPDGNSTCGSICGLILLASLAFGEAVGKVFAFGLFSSVGLFLCFIGYKLKTANGT